ncbi:MAG: deoxyribodipyrimidine photo-lyase [Patescibacteria group bacterium]
MSTQTELVIYWIRRDFRLTDNPALSEAINFAKANNLQILPIFILDGGLLDDNNWNIGRGRRYALSQIVGNFSKHFASFSVLVGSPQEIFKKISKDRVIHVFTNEDIEPYSIQRDTEVKNIVEKNKGSFHSFKDQLTVSTQTRTGSGNIYSVFSPFRKAVLEEFMNVKSYEKVQIDHSFILSKPEGLELIKDLGFEHIDYARFDELQDKIFAAIDKPNTLYLDQGKHKLNIDELVEYQYSPTELDNEWYFSEEECLAEFEAFVDDKLLKYKEKRDSLELDTYNRGQTSKISLGLKWGLVSARTLKDLIVNKYGTKISSNQNIFHFISELIWREFYRYVLYHNPEVLNQEYQEKFQNSITWVEDQEALERFKKWCQGKTGYKVVDAAMNQLNKSGWMHNRSRMIVASILTKNLGVDWRWGQDYFRLMLVDLEEASNNGGWQWGASTGADQKPIRIFNPYLQQEKYDKKGAYLQQWLPQNYNWELKPIVEHTKARDEAKARYGLDKNSSERDY